MENVKSKKIKSRSNQTANARWDMIWSNALVIIVTLLWLIPVIWVVLRAFGKYDGQGYVSQTFFPTEYSMKNFIDLFTYKSLRSNPLPDFVQWLLNTFIIAIVNTILTTFFTILTAYVLSRFRFGGRKLMMNIALILGMFPGFMAMIAVYLILNMLNMINSIWSLLIYYVAGAGLGFFTAKGYFDTIGKELDEAAMLDGASKAKIFFKIFLPLAKPIIIYTALLAFMAPWSDYILAGLVLSGNNQTVAVGLYNWMDVSNVNQFFGMFCAAAVIVAIPTVTLYISLQKFFISGISAGAVKG